MVIIKIGSFRRFAIGMAIRIARHVAYGIRRVLGKSSAALVGGNAPGKLTRRLIWFLLAPRQLKNALQNLKNAKGDSLVLIRALYPERMSSVDPRVVERVEGKDKDIDVHPFGSGRFLSDDWLSLMMLEALGTQIRVQPGAKTWFKHYISNPDETKSSHNDGGDMPLRFRNATPSLKIPIKDRYEYDEMARYLIIQCVENVISDPIYALRVNDVVAALENRAINNAGQTPIEILNQERFEKVGDWDREEFKWEQPKEKRSVLHNDGTDESPDWLAAFDEDRVRYGNFEERKALGAFARAIETACKAGRVERIDLIRYDALIVDNPRVLLARRERPHQVLDGNYFGRLARLNIANPRLRWLRVLHGFRPTHLDGATT